MIIKRLEEEDLINLYDFLSDENRIKEFINTLDCYGFIVKENDKIIGFAYGYSLNRPDKRGPMFYIHSIDILSPYRNQGYGTMLMKYIDEFAQSIGCSKCFVITNKQNILACYLYHKTGFSSDYQDEIVYVKKYD